ncbi:hypothetical protein FRC12_013027 [Ceratobasidium sp. 428]|nr:hypothetical protein FRC12_013027 [Ceratobasidium sp. 428]
MNGLVLGKIIIRGGLDCHWVIQRQGQGRVSSLISGTRGPPFPQFERGDDAGKGAGMGHTVYPPLTFLSILPLSLRACYYLLLTMTRSLSPDSSSGRLISSDVLGTD